MEGDISAISDAYLVSKIVIQLQEAICTTALFLPEDVPYTWEEVIPLDNVIGGVAGLFALIGGGLGLGFCCESQKRTHQSHSVRAFLAFSLIGIPVSLFAVVVNVNSVLSLVYFLNGNNGLNNNHSIESTYFFSFRRFPSFVGSLSDSRESVRMANGRRQRRLWVNYHNNAHCFCIF